MVRTIELPDLYSNIDFTWSTFTFCLPILFANQFEWLLAVHLKYGLIDAILPESVISFLLANNCFLPVLSFETHSRRLDWWNIFLSNMCRVVLQYSIGSSLGTNDLHLEKAYLSIWRQSLSQQQSTSQYWLVRSQVHCVQAVSSLISASRDCHFKSFFSLRFLELLSGWVSLLFDSRGWTKHKCIKNTRKRQALWIAVAIAETSEFPRQIYQNLWEWCLCPSGLRPSTLSAGWTGVRVNRQMNLQPTVMTRRWTDWPICPLMSPQASTFCKWFSLFLVEMECLQPRNSQVNNVPVDLDATLQELVWANLFKYVKYTSYAWLIITLYSFGGQVYVNRMSPTCKSKFAGCVNLCLSFRNSF